MKLFYANKFFTVVFIVAAYTLAFKVSPVIGGILLIANLLETYTQYLLEKRMFDLLRNNQQSLLELDNYETSTPPKEGNC